MTFAELKRMLEVSVARADLAGEYGNWINRGIRAVQRDYSFNCMRTVDSTVMLAGTSSAKMPADFKELVIESGSVCLMDTLLGRVPLEVITREKLIRLNVQPLPYAPAYPKIFLSNDGKDAFLNVFDNTSADTTFEVAYFRYLPELVADSDENYITREFEDLVQAKVKAVAFSVINDPQVVTELSLYDAEKKKAIFFDTRQRTQGRNVQMGG